MEPSKCLAVQYLGSRCRELEGVASFILIEQVAWPEDGTLGTMTSLGPQCQDVLRSAQRATRTGHD